VVKTVFWASYARGDFVKFIFSSYLSVAPSLAVGCVVTLREKALSLQQPLTGSPNTYLIRRRAYFRVLITRQTHN